MRYSEVSTNATMRKWLSDIEKNLTLLGLSEYSTELEFEEELVQVNIGLNNGDLEGSIEFKDKDIKKLHIEQSVLHTIIENTSIGTLVITDKVVINTLHFKESVKIQNLELLNLNYSLETIGRTGIRNASINRVDVLIDDGCFYSSLLISLIRNINVDCNVLHLKIPLRASKKWIITGKYNKLPADLLNDCYKYLRKAANIKGEIEGFTVPYETVTVYHKRFGARGLSSTSIQVKDIPKEIKTKMFELFRRDLKTLVKGINKSIKVLITLY